MSNESILLRRHAGADLNERARFRHPIFAWLGIRPAWGQHTRAEHAALKHWAAGRSNLVEIGVAEGGSAVILREAMSPSGTLWLIDPFHLSRFQAINATKRVARRLVGNCKNGMVIWIEKFSIDAIKEWKSEIDCLFIDGDHSEAGVQKDWDDWSRFVVGGGIVIFHDARLFENGWTAPDWGPVNLVNRLFRGEGKSAWTIIEEVDSLVVVRRVGNIDESNE